MVVEEEAVEEEVVAMDMDTDMDTDTEEDGGSKSRKSSDWNQPKILDASLSQYQVTCLVKPVLLNQFQFKVLKVP